MEQPVEETAAVNEFEMPHVQRTFELPTEDAFELPSFQQPSVEPFVEPVVETENEQVEEQHQEEVQEVQNDLPVVDYEKLYLEEKAINEELMIKLARIKEML